MDEARNNQKQKFNWFYMFWDGFRAMSKQSKTLWIIAVIKLVIMFAVLKPFFFPNFLKTQVNEKTDKADYVREQLIDRSSIESAEDNSNY